MGTEYTELAYKIYCVTGSDHKIGSPSTPRNREGYISNRGNNVTQYVVARQQGGHLIILIDTNGGYIGLGDGEDLNQVHDWLRSGADSVDGEDTTCAPCEITDDYLRQLHNGAQRLLNALSDAREIYASADDCEDLDWWAEIANEAIAYGAVSR